MQRAIGQAERKDRRPALRIACKGIVVAIDDFNFGRKRGSVGAGSAVFRVRLGSLDVAYADHG